MYICRAFIRKNTKELREKLKNRGHTVCPCCTFNGSIWLSNCPENKDNYVHGIGYICEEFGITSTSQAISIFLHESANNYDIDCGEDEDLFIDLISLRDDTDLGQLFTDDQGNYLRSNCDSNTFNQNSILTKWRKCSIIDIINYYKKD